MEFKVSVVIPVYNAEKYVREAVESCLRNLEVAEIILVEDRSPDNALFVCKQLEAEFEIVKLFTHPHNANRGAGASRNLGIEKAECDYIAFLDADDVMCENRFRKAKEVFLSQPDADGVYDAITHFSEERGIEKKLFTINKENIPPEKLFYFLLRGTYGHFSTDGIVIKRKVFEKSGTFHTELKLHQDAELWLRIAYHARLFAGELKHPVALARRHTQNRITGANYHSKVLFWQTAFDYFKNKASLKHKLMIAYKLAGFRSKQNGKNIVFNLLRLLVFNK